MISQSSLHSVRSTPSSSSNESAETTGTTKTAHDEGKDTMGLANEGNKGVRASLLVVSAVMLVIASSVTVATFLFFTQEETSDFEASVSGSARTSANSKYQSPSCPHLVFDEQFSQSASTVIDAILYRSRSLQQNFHDLSDHITGHATTSNSSWPFVTFPFFDVHGANLRSETDVVGLWMIPVVSAENLLAWNRYSVEHEDWFDGFHASAIFHLNEDGKIDSNIGAGPYAPVWQTDPQLLIPLVNLDTFVRPGANEAFRNAELLNQGIVGPVMSGQERLGNVFPGADWSAEPYSNYDQPVYDVFDPASRRVVAMLQGFLRWGTYFDDVLPNGVDGVLVVLENTCGQVRCWNIRGNEAAYSAEEECHKDNYVDMRQSTIFNPYTDTKQAVELGVCVFEISVYPLAEYEARFKHPS